MHHVWCKEGAFDVNQVFLLKTLVPVMAALLFLQGLSEIIRIEMLLDNAKITDIQKQFIKTATNDSTEWDIVVA